MSFSVSEDIRTRSIKQELDANIDSLTDWLRENSAEHSAQARGDEGMYERLSWHYGYLIALRDIRALLVAA